MKLAKSFGLPVPDVDLLKIAEKDIFVVERYDRIKEADSIQRLHQEDFSLLAESLNIKYSVLSKIFDDFAKKVHTSF